LTMAMTMTMTWRSLSKVWKTILFISNLSLNKTQTLFQLKWLLSFFQHFFSLFCRLSQCWCFANDCLSLSVDEKLRPNFLFWILTFFIFPF
jgi:hypothetical protein